MAGDVTIAYEKYDGTPHWQVVVRQLGQDAHGTWLGHPAGTTIRKGDEPPVWLTHPAVALLPQQAPWVAWFNGEPGELEVYCDVTTVPHWPAPDRVTMVDLDLDVCRVRADGSVRVLDEDEFAAHQVRYGYPPELVATATRTAAELAAALADGTEPFAGDYRAWLAWVS